MFDSFSYNDIILCYEAQYSYSPVYTQIKLGVCVRVRERERERETMRDKQLTTWRHTVSYHDSWWSGNQYLSRWLVICYTLAVGVQWRESTCWSLTLGGGGGGILCTCMCKNVFSAMMISSICLPLSLSPFVSSWSLSLSLSAIFLELHLSLSDSLWE